jgi:diguanylate cyclase
MFTLICVLIALQYIYYQVKWHLGLALINNTWEKLLSGIVSGLMAVILSFYVLETHFDVNFGLAATVLLVGLFYSGKSTFIISYIIFAIWSYLMPYSSLVFNLEVYILIGLMFLVIDTLFKSKEIYIKGLVALFALSAIFCLNLYFISYDVYFSVSITALYLMLTTISLFVSIGVIHYQQEFVRLHRRLAAEATHDGLTGLLNRRSFEEAIKQLDSKNEAALLMIDIDHFKKINDTYGHPTGDAVLEATAAALRAACKVKATIARVGGEEFAVLLRNQDMESAKMTAEDIRAAIEALSIEFDEGIVKITISIGIAGYPEQVKSPEQLYKIADEHLYMAKKLGRNQVCFERKQSVIVE